MADLEILELLSLKMLVRVRQTMSFDADLSLSISKNSGNSLKFTTCIHPNGHNIYRATTDTFVQFCRNHRNVL
jgi:hypothetical protein